MYLLFEVVYAFVEPGVPLALEVQRAAGEPKEDRLVVQHMPAGEAAEAKECFPPGKYDTKYS